jgi:tetratricopeptide (TPR) repeat protein
MGLFTRSRPYDRNRLLSEAAKAQTRKRFKRALAIYEEVLRAEPNNPEIHRRVAPLLARRKQRDRAWQSFRFAAEALVNGGFYDKAIGVYRQATHYLPREITAWLAIAELHIHRDRQSSAVEVLLEARCHFRRRKHRPEAIRLLARAREIAPSHFEVNLDLARLLAKTDSRRMARRILAELAPHCHRRQLVRLRSAQFRLSPTPAAALRWLRALVTGE